MCTSVWHEFCNLHKFTYMLSAFSDVRILRCIARAHHEEIVQNESTAKQLEWTKKFENWSVKDWENVVNSDEPVFRIYSHRHGSKFFPLREVIILRRDAIEENNCLFQLSLFNV